MQAKANASIAAAVPVPGATAEIVAFRPPARPAVERLREFASRAAGILLPPLIVLAVTLIV